MIKTFFKRLRRGLEFRLCWLRSAPCGTGFVLTMSPHGRCSFWLELTVEAEVQKRLTDISFTSEEDADKIIDTYSGGMKRKVLIAMSLIGNPDLVFLDEVRFRRKC